MKKCEHYLALLGEIVSTFQKKQISVERGPVMLYGLLLSALVHRLHDFGTIAYECLKQDKNMPAVLLVRSLMETTAVLLAVTKEVEAAVTTKNASSLYARFSQVPFGGRRDDINLKATNVLTYIDKAEKAIVGFRQNYDLFSEYAHPNMLGVFGGYLNFGEENKTVTLNQKARDWHIPPGHEVSGLHSHAGSSQLASPIDGALPCSPTIDRRADEENLLLQNVRIS